LKKVGLADSISAKEGGPAQFDAEEPPERYPLSKNKALEERECAEKD